MGDSLRLFYFILLIFPVYLIAIVNCPGDERFRTVDLMRAKHAFYLLNYIPVTHPRTLRYKTITGVFFIFESSLQHLLMRTFPRYKRLSYRSAGSSSLRWEKCRPSCPSYGQEGQEGQEGGGAPGFPAAPYAVFPRMKCRP